MTKPTVSPHIDVHLIEKALALGGKTMADMNEIVHGGDYGYINEFSIEKFCYYLLSPEFIEKYDKYYPSSINKGNWIAKDFGEAIYQYQSGDKEPLEDLLKKITI